MADEFGYLVLSRRDYERIVVITPDGTELEIVALPTKNGQHRIGIEAPKNFRVVRDEILEKERVPQAF